MNIEESLAVGGALADRSRLLILGALLSGPMCVEELANRLELASSTVSFHLKKLKLAGLVDLKKEQYYAVYALRPDLQALTVRDLIGFQDTGAGPRAERVDQERARVLATFFSEGRLTRMPAQKRKRDMVLEEFAALFPPGSEYEEPQVDRTISTLYADYCLVRRLLVDSGYLRRQAGRYRRTDKPARGTRSPWVGESGETQMSPHDETSPRDDTDSRARRAALRRAYKERAKQAGVFRVLNTANGRVMLGSALDLHAPLNRVKFELDMGMCWNPQLKADLETYGRDSFVIEVLETVESREEPDFDPERELAILEQRHLATFDRTTAYNKDDRIRYP